MTQKLKFIIASVFCCILSSSVCEGSDSVRALRVGEEIWQVQYGVMDGKLSYLVFDGPKELPYGTIVKISGSSFFDPKTQESKVAKRSAILHCPDSRKLELAGSGRIFLVSKGQISEMKFRVPAKVLEEFLDSNPRQLTFDALRKFAESRS